MLPARSVLLHVLRTDHGRWLAEPLGRSLYSVVLHASIGEVWVTVSP